MKKFYRGISFPFTIDNLGRTKESEMNLSMTERVNQSITQILGTRKGERVKEPQFGTDLFDYLFEKIGDETIYPIIGHIVVRDLETQEKRIELTNVDVYPSEELEATIVIDIKYIVTRYGIEGNHRLELDERGIISE